MGYGQQAELGDLIHEMQWPEVKKGASLAGIAESLGKRGVYHKAVSIPREVPIRWRYPVVVNLTGEGGGHFVALLPGETSDEHVLWSSGHGVTPLKGEARIERRSEVLLLTAPEEIGAEDIAQLQDPQWVFFCFTIGIPVGTFLALCVWGRVACPGRRSSQKESANV